MITPSFSLTATERVLPSMALDFTSGALDSRVTFTRVGATATVVDSAGYVVAAGVDVPRFDYDPVTLACKGLLIEESRSNLLTYSEDMFTGWNKSRLAVTTDYILGPDNTTSGNYLLCNATSVNGMNVSKTSLTFSGSALTTSFFIKKGYDNYAVVILYDNASNGVRQWFNVNTGAVASSNTFGTGWAKTNATITPYPNGWYRCTLSVSTTGTTCALAIGPSTPSDLGFGCTSGVTYGYLWGAQLEAGAFATSYIPTTTAQVTRTADVATMTGTNFSDWFNASEGTFACHYDVIGLKAANGAWAVSDGTIQNRMILRGNNTSSQVVSIGVVSNVTQWGIINGGSHPLNTINGVSVGYKVNDIAMCDHGGGAITDTSASIPTVNQFRIGADGDGSNPLCGHIQRLEYWPQRLTNNECRAFSK